MRSLTSSIAVGFCFVLVQFGQAQDFTIFPSDDPPSITFGNETGNNTSACFANGSPSYCNEALPNLKTSAANQAAGAQTLVVDAFPEHTSTISVKRLLYSGWTGQLICEYEPWFSNNGGTSHIDIGYDEHNTATLANQDTKMINRGCNINLISFYGSRNQSSDITFDRITTDMVFQDLAGRVGTDVTALTATAGPNAGNTVAYLANNPNAYYIRTGIGALADSGRNTLETPNTNNFDLGVYKDLNLGERMKFRLGAQFGNIINHPQYIPGSNPGYGLGVNDVASFASVGTGYKTFVTPGKATFNDPKAVFASNARSIGMVAKFSF